MIAERSKLANIFRGFYIGRIVGVHMFSWKAIYYKHTREWVLTLLNRSKEVYILVRENKAMARATCNIKDFLTFFPLEINFFHLFNLVIFYVILSTLPKTIISNSKESIFFNPSQREFQSTCSFAYFMAL